jgi:GT2 family glycosyltransferase
VLLLSTIALTQEKRMKFAWDRLPAPLLEGLCAGGVGKVHLLRLAAGCLDGRFSGQAGPELLSGLGLDLLCAAWESDPLDPALAAQLLAAARPEGAFGALLAAVAGSGNAAPDDPAARAVQQAGRQLRRGEDARARELLGAALEQAPGNPALLRAALDLAWRCGRTQWALQLLDAPSAGAQALALLLPTLRADMLLLAGAAARAEAEYAQAGAALPLPTLLWRRGECLCRLGRRDESLALWRAAHAARPWCVNLLLRAHDVLAGRDAHTAPPDGPAAVLLYSWNKAELLDATLGALFASDLCGARVFALDNGSADATPAVLRAWRERAGADRLEVIRLPVNVGAPAARNWLVSLPGLDACRWAAFLDDDALPPSDWLLRLGAAAQAYPGAGAYGCKVRDAANPAVIQNADLHLRPGLGAPPAPREVGCAVALTDLHLQEPDFGQFDCLRPCVSVTGCCHLLRVETLRASGGFDIALSPSQLDDMDHDLRLNAGGSFAVCQGHLAVGHARRSGAQTRLDARAAAHAYGNLAKIERRADARELAGIAARDAERLARELPGRSAELLARG